MPSAAPLLNVVLRRLLFSVTPLPPPPLGGAAAASSSSFQFEGQQCQLHIL
ncbi:hypothetical protein HN873_047775, partial [Arachis hypogaea]